MGLGTAVIDVGVASRPRPGSTVSGDLHVVREQPSGALLAVIDGLGHGGEAEDAALAAEEALLEHPSGPPAELLRHCHERLRRTRGAVMSVAVLDLEAARLTWVGVGNVEGVLVRRSPDAEERRSLLVRGGVVGYRLPSLMETVSEMQAGDSLIVATDGVRHSALRETPLAATAAETARAVLTAGWTGSDDALVLAVTNGGSP